MSLLLTRDDFRNRTLSRHNGKCCVPSCNNVAKDAHHIIERRLWDDGGYYFDNGAAVCEEHHIQAETTELSVEQLREYCDIRTITIPDGFYKEEKIDKWGNPILPNGNRLRGPLFDDESVQKILKQGNMLQLFSKWIKYPRTCHLPFSPGARKDDRVWKDCSAFEGKEVVVTIKMDGENTTIYSDGLHARSIDGRNHPSRAWVKGFWAQLAGNIPEDLRICGENLYAKHSIHYEDLTSYFLGFSVWTDRNVCLGWDDTLEWFELLDISPVKEIYRGIFDEKIIKKLAADLEKSGQEGLVVRLAAEFKYSEFSTSVAKFVKKDFVPSSHGHWSKMQIVPNKLVE